ncbi:DsrE family protein [Enterococcus sp. LJL90]
MKVVFHIDEKEKWPEARSNVKNLLQATATIEVIVLVNGGAVTGYLEPAYQHFISNPKISFHACHNALKANDIAEEQLPKNVEVVPAGVLDLVKLQSNGYAYIKP